ncbi:hypothetical protein ANN_08498 [Periplaneta americana]|uniref:Uncharacterized protein n=1 Tax=Periplaneta americana TaxID=6978 RepID=A0ABQ8T2S4_PERAM|nr:hypothetical protein ANN_08498 [Periplaneta americana]
MAGLCEGGDEPLGSLKANFNHWFIFFSSLYITIHKLQEIIRHAIVPIGQLSEEVQEARNKEFKKYREGFSRKVSRTKTNEDVLNVLLISSDPIIFSLRKMPKKKVTQFDKEVLDMLRAPDVRSAVRDSSDDTDSANEAEESRC